MLKTSTKCQPLILPYACTEKNYLTYTENYVRVYVFLAMGTSVVRAAMAAQAFEGMNGGLLDINEYKLLILSLWAISQLMHSISKCSRQKVKNSV